MGDFNADEAARVINELLMRADDAVKQDPKVREHSRRAGALLIEAYPQLAHHEWPGWLERNFKITPKTAERYMALAREELRRQKKEGGQP